MEYDRKLSVRGDHPSYIREDLTQTDLNRLVVDKLEGNIRKDPSHYYEFINCDETIGYYYSKQDGKYVETHCAQVAYAVADGNIHIIPVKDLGKENNYA